MSDITCPYDGDYCYKMQERVDSARWGMTLRPECPWVVMNTRNFQNCPIETAKARHEACQRYRRYEYIIKTFGQIQK